MIKSPVKFQKNQHKNVGVLRTRGTYFREVQKCGRTPVRQYAMLNTTLYVPSLFFEKARDNKYLASFSGYTDCFVELSLRNSTVVYDREGGYLMHLAPLTSPSAFKGHPLTKPNF